MKKLLPVLFITIGSFQSAVAQLLSDAPEFTHADTLRGSIGPGRNWWNVLYYDITVKPDIATKTIEGITTIKFSQLKEGNIMQVDLQQPLIIDSLSMTSSSQPTKEFTKQEDFNIRRDGNAYFIKVPAMEKGEWYFLKVYYHGKPLEAVKPPWDGGWIWKKDNRNNPWVSVACQGLGASVWFPCKDHQSDEPDQGAALHIIVPDSLVAVGNGRLTEIKPLDNHTRMYSWQVENPINNYTIIPCIGKYVHFNEVYKGEKGSLDMDYWVLEENLDKAKAHFTDAPKMMKAFEYWFGPYPFYKDGYKLVDAPHLGMEHQSATAYGNQYKMGYLGRDRSGTGWGLKWDYIIVHESGHEWFANNITTKDIADMWVHEGFTCYSETLFTEYYYGKEAANEYCQGLRLQVSNDRPIIGAYNVNSEGSRDMYDKGANMLHTIRQVIHNDSLFRKILRGLNSEFYHQTVTTQQVETYFSKQSGIDFSSVFNQYLRTINIPVLEYKIKGRTLSYRWTNCVKGFEMPLKINFDGEYWIKPGKKWQKLQLVGKGNNNFSADANFYINTKKVD